MSFNTITAAAPLFAAVAAGMLTAAPAAAAREHAVTVYSKLSPGAIDPRTFQRQISNPDYRQQIPGYAIIRTMERAELSAGVSQVDFQDVAAGLDPTTVKFESLTDPEGTHVREQDFLYDLASTDQMLERYIDQRIEVTVLAGEQPEVIAGRLLAARNGDLLLDSEDGGVVSVANGPRNIRFPELAEGLLTRPTLRWEVAAEQGGAHDVQLTYETLGMTWWTDYTLVQSDANGCTVDLSAWVSLVNQSGGSYGNAKLKLVAGDVNRAPRATEVRPVRRTMALEMADSAGFEEQSFFEYHLYTLDRAVDLPDRSLKQLELFAPVLGVPCRKTLRVPRIGSRWGGNNPYTQPQYPVQEPRSDVAAYLSFENSEAAGLGVPMPRGRVRVSRRDPADGALEFIGEDNIDHTPRGERIELTLGTSFDVVAERRQADFAWSKNERWMEETVEVRLRNRKDVDETVEVDESLYRWSNWSLKQTSHDFEKLDANGIRFTVNVPANEEVVVRYVARYSW